MYLLAGLRGTPANVQRDLHIQPPIYTGAYHHMYRKLHTFNCLFTPVHAITCTENSTHSTTDLQLCMPSYIQNVSHIQLPIYIFNHLFSTVRAIIYTESFTHQPLIYNCACCRMYCKFKTFNHLFASVHAIKSKFWAQNNCWQHNIHETDLFTLKYR